MNPGFFISSFVVAGIALMVALSGCTLSAVFDGVVLGNGICMLVLGVAYQRRVAAGKATLRNRMT